MCYIISYYYYVLAYMPVYKADEVRFFQKKTPTYVFDYNSGVSRSIFILFIPVEREMITLQFTYLQSYDIITASPCTPQKFTS